MDKERAFLRELELAEHEARRARGGEREARLTKTNVPADERDDAAEPAGYAPDLRGTPRRRGGA